jgi:hypothetical protein
MRYLNDSVKPLLAALPIAISGEGSAFSGAIIDRRNYESALFTIMTGVSGGTPTRTGVVFKVQTCASSTGVFADVLDEDSETRFTTSISGERAAIVGEVAHIDVDLLACERYIKLVATPSWPDGSSPSVLIGATCVLGDAKVLPAV